MENQFYKTTPMTNKKLFMPTVFPYLIITNTVFYLTQSYALNLLISMIHTSPTEFIQKGYLLYRYQNEGSSFSPLAPATFLDPVERFINSF